MNKIGILILVAGQGTRMKSPLPKVLHSISGQPLLVHLLNRIHELETVQAEVCIVIGHGREKVQEAVNQWKHAARHKIQWAVQENQKGTGHAVQCALESPWGKSILQNRDLPILILPGDQPLMSLDLLEKMCAPLSAPVGLRLLSCEMGDPTGYGRVVRKENQVEKIVEHRDADSKTREIREVATSVYLFQNSFLSEGIKGLSNKNAQGEYYLTDLISSAREKGLKVDSLVWQKAEDLMGINTLWELAQAEKAMNKRINKKWCEFGVRIRDPENTWIETDVVLEEGATIEPHTFLKGDTHVARGSEVGSHVTLISTRVGQKTKILSGSYCENSQIGNEATVGPYARLRPDSTVGDHCKIGNYVELKNSRIGTQTSIAHLSYLGDAVVGENVNIGCGFITCNFDGRVIDGKRKHPTIIEDNVFMGSDCQTVAPVHIKKGAYIASGSTITKDVESDALAIARSHQTNKPGYGKKLREK